MMSIFIQILCGILLADFLSGVVHWIQDRYARSSWLIVGRAVADAHTHHEKPLKMLSASFLKRNGSTFILVGFIALIIGLLDGFNLVTVVALIVGAFANEIHATTHRYRSASPWWLKTLRFTGLVQTPHHHDVHHRYKDSRPPHYCVITNWLNPSLDHLSFWLGIEFSLAKIGILSSAYQKSK